VTEVTVCSQRLLDQEAYLVRVSGPLTADKRHEVRRSVQKCLTEAPAAVVIDLSGIVLLDHLAAATFVAIHRDAAETGPGVPVLLAGPPDAALSLRIRSLQPDQPIYPTVADAIRAIADYPPEAHWIFHRLGDGLMAPTEAGLWIVKACQRWQIPSMSLRARLTAFDLTVTAHLCPPGPMSLAAVNDQGNLRIAIRTRSVQTTIATCDGRTRHPQYRHWVTANGHILWTSLPLRAP
jgi:anti-anti-sigma regulatory factor